MLAASAVASPASAALSRTGPVDPATHFPAWYADTSGMALQLCLDGLPNCLAARGDLKAPDGEAFWWFASADVPVGNDTVTVELALEAAFAGDTPIAFDRFRIRGTVPSTGTWTIRHPFGSQAVPVSAVGARNLNFTDDVGCAPAAPGDVCNFDTARTGRTVNFLRWDATAPAPPAGFIGDAATPHTVTGGTLRNNVELVAPNGTVVGQTAEWTIQGKVAAGPIATVLPSAQNFGPVGLLRTATRTSRLTNVGTAAMTVSSAAVSGSGAFTKSADGCTGATLAPGAGCSVTVAFRPAARVSYAGALSFATNALANPAPIRLSGSGAVAPAAPVMRGAVGGDRSARVSWSAPTDNGGAAITAWRVLVRNLTTGASSSVLAPAAARSHVVSGLRIGQTYVFSVLARNVAGESRPSAASNPITGFGRPSAPIIGVASSGSTADTVTTAVARWGAPTSTGGRPLTAYRVIAVRSDGVLSSKLVSPALRALNFTGLVRGDVYRFQVQAVNAAGSSARSALSNAVVAR